MDIKETLDRILVTAYDFLLKYISPHISGGTMAAYIIAMVACLFSDKTRWISFAMFALLSLALIVVLFGGWEKFFG